MRSMILGPVLDLILADQNFAEAGAVNLNLRIVRVY